MKKKEENQKKQRIVVGIAGLAIAMAAGISLAVLIGQEEKPAQTQDGQTLTQEGQMAAQGAQAQSQERADGTDVGAQAQPQEQQEVILWTMRATPILEECVGNFNRGDYGYRVMIHECYGEGQNVSWEDALLRLQMSLSGSNTPDIILAESFDVSAETLAEQGMLEDLTPYFAESEVVHQEDFLENVTASYTYDGKLAALPRWISIRTLWGKSEIVGDAPGWTVQDMLSLSERCPDIPMTGQFVRWEFAGYCMQFVPETFWLEPDGEATDALKKLLEQTASFPMQIDYSKWDEQYLQVCRKEALLTEQEVNKLETLLYFQEFAADERLVPIGYPTADGTPKAVLSPINGLYAIPAGASNKEGAWAFLELFFAGKLDPERAGVLYQTSGIPTNKQELEEAFQWQFEDELQRQLHKIDDMDEEQIAAIAEWMEELLAMASVYPPYVESFRDIIIEEGELYFQGDKTLDETLQVIENRGKLYFQENAD